MRANLGLILNMPETPKGVRSLQVAYMKEDDIEHTVSNIKSFLNYWVENTVRTGFNNISVIFQMN